MSRLSLLVLSLLLVSLPACRAGDEAEPGAENGRDDRDDRVASYTIGADDEYVAFGDSYTAAPQTGPLDGDDGCYRSTTNYPHLVAEATGAELADVSCSAASSDALTMPQTTPSGTSRPPQLDALSRSTDLVTLRIGGNDFDIFGTLVLRCVGAAQSDPDGSPCADHDVATGKRQVDRKLAAVEARIAAAVDAIEERAPDARVIVVGYPQIVSADGTCALLPLAEGDYAFARRVNVSLNEALAAGARRAGAEYVDVFAATEGHDVCAAVPWVAGARATREGAIPWHPYPEEQEKVATLVLELLS